MEAVVDAKAEDIPSVESVIPESLDASSPDIVSQEPTLDAPSTAVDSASTAVAHTPILDNKDTTDIVPDQSEPAADTGVPDSGEEAAPEKAATFAATEEEAPGTVEASPLREDAAGAAPAVAEALPVQEAPVVDEPAPRISVEEEVTSNVEERDDEELHVVELPTITSESVSQAIDDATEAVQSNGLEPEIALTSEEPQAATQINEAEPVVGTSDAAPILVEETGPAVVATQESEEEQKEDEVTRAEAATEDSAAETTEEPSIKSVEATGEPGEL